MRHETVVPDMDDMRIINTYQGGVLSGWGLKKSIRMLIQVLVAMAAGLWHAQAAETSGHLYVSDLDVHAIHRFSRSGLYLGEFVKRRSGTTHAH